MQQDLRLRPGQQTLAPAQEQEARRFAEERTRAQLSIEPVDEPKAERLLRQAYAVAKLPPPQHIHWLDGPLQLLAVLAPPSLQGSPWDSLRASVEASVWESVRASVGFSVWHS